MSVLAERKEKTILYEISDLYIYCRSFLSCFRQLAFCPGVLFISPCVAVLITILKTPSAKWGGILKHSYYIPLEPSFLKLSSAIDKTLPLPKANIIQGSEFKQKFHLWVVRETPSPKGQYIFWHVWFPERSLSKEIKIVLYTHNTKGKVERNNPMSQC